MTSPLSFAAGDMTIHRIVEMAGPTLGLRQMLPGLSEAGLAEHRGWLAPDALDADDQAIMLFQSYHVRLLAAPGHTPHHVAVLLGRGRDEAAFAGDLLHSP
jgi:glyoxylase-like metal-dependent hydrolase (beta-lactamase superfamily II)